MVALVAGTDIHLDDIAFGEQPFAGNSVNHFIVDADAGAGRKTVVMQERWRCAVRRDKAVNLGIDMNQRNARLYQSRRKLQRACRDFACFAHQRDFLVVFDLNHAKPVLNAVFRLIFDTECFCGKRGGILKLFLTDHGAQDAFFS